jgi:protocatechuate 3,4-dioxygenase beta subunit
MNNAATAPTYRIIIISAVTALSPFAGSVKPAAGAPTVISGRVVDVSTGNPIASASVYLTSEPERHKTSDGQGRFHFDEAETKSAFTTAEADRLRGGVDVVAVAPEYGIDFIKLRPWGTPSIQDLPAAQGQNITLRLPKDDSPIEGQLVDVDDQPVAGAEVQLREVYVLPKNDLAAWLNTWQNSRGQHWSSLVSRQIEKRYFPLRRGWDSAQRITATGEVPARYLQWPEPFLKTITATDEAGRFSFKNVGQGRVAWLEVKHSDFEPTEIFVATGHGLEIKAIDPRLPAHYGSRFVHQLQRPTPSIRGTVRAQSSGERIADVRVVAGLRSAKTDAKGSFTLTQLPKRKHVLWIEPPVGAPFLVRELEVDQTQQEGPIDVDCELISGVVVTGKVLDPAGRGVSGAIVSYFEAPGNPHAKRAGLKANVNKVTARDGSFYVTVPPGPGAISARIWYGGPDQFQPCLGTDFERVFAGGRSFESADGRQLYEFTDGRKVDTSPSHAQAIHALANINPQNEGDRQEIELQLKSIDRGARKEGKQP